MSTRIIIEKDGERYACDAFDVDILRYDGGYLVQMNGALPMTELPPVIRTDNSEVIARLEAENAELKRTIDDNLRVAKACRDSDQDEKFELRQERSRLICENAKLREALKPVMECTVVSYGNNRYGVVGDSGKAVRKAQAIMNDISRKDDDISRKAVRHD